jgi:hypothetical protein
MTDKRERRTKSEMTAIRQAIYEACASSNPRTIRGLFYHLVGAGLIEKTEAAYKSTVVRLCTDMREAGELPWEWLTDNSRWMRKSPSYNSIDDFRERVKSLFRRALWRDQNRYVEVWCEKATLAGLIVDETDEWDVPLMCTSGFSSVGFLHSAALEIESRACRTFIYYLGDYDPSGLKIWENTQTKLRQYMQFDDLISFEKLAVTPEQITTYNLPTRPTKHSNHSRDWNGDESVELDAMPTDALVGLVRDAIKQHIDERAYDVTKLAEESERQQLWPAGKT